MWLSLQVLFNHLVSCSHLMVDNDHSRMVVLRDRIGSSQKKKKGRQWLKVVVCIFLTMCMISELVCECRCLVRFSTGLGYAECLVWRLLYYFTAMAINGGDCTCLQCYRHH